MNTNLSFACDYMEGCHPAILEKLTETNLIKTPGYGLDDYTRSACENQPAGNRRHRFSFLPAAHKQMPP